MASLWNWPSYVYEMMRSAAMASLWNRPSYVYEMMRVPLWLTCWTGRSTCTKR